MGRVDSAFVFGNHEFVEELIHLALKVTSPTFRCWGLGMGNLESCVYLELNLFQMNAIKRWKAKVPIYVYYQSDVQS
jgi:hypothetical protein